MSTVTASPVYPAQPMRAALDLALVILFIAIGLLSHGQSLTAVPVTAAPFLLATLAAHIAVWVVSSRRRLPLLLEGFMLWGVTLTVGMALRISFGDTAATAFVVVSAVTLLVFLVGWRAIMVVLKKGR